MAPTWQLHGTYMVATWQHYKAQRPKQLETGQTCSKWSWRGLPMIDGCLQMPFQQGKLCWCGAGCHGGRAVLDNVLGQVPQPGLAS